MSDFDDEEDIYGSDDDDYDGYDEEDELLDEEDSEGYETEEDPPAETPAPVEGECRVVVQQTRSTCHYPALEKLSALCAPAVAGLPVRVLPVLCGRHGCAAKVAESSSLQKWRNNAQRR